MSDEHRYEDAEIAPSYALPLIPSRFPPPSSRTESQPPSAALVPAVRAPSEEFAINYQSQYPPGQLFSPFNPYMQMSALRSNLPPPVFTPHQQSSAYAPQMAVINSSQPSNYSSENVKSYQHPIIPQPSNYSSEDVKGYQHPIIPQPSNYSSHNIASRYQQPIGDSSQPSNYSSENVNSYQHPIIPQPSNYSSQNISSNQHPIIPQPSNYSSQNISSNQQPNNYSSQNISSNQQPNNYSSQNISSNQQPNNYSSQNISSNQQPNNYSSQNISSNQQPNNYSSQNISSNQQPNNYSSQNISSNQQPNNYSSQNISSYQQPNNYSSHNASRHQQPVINSSLPNNYSSQNSQPNNGSTQLASYHVPTNQYNLPPNNVYSPANNYALPTNYGTPQIPQAHFPPHANNGIIPMSNYSSFMQTQAPNDSPFLRSRSNSVPQNPQPTVQSKDAMNAPHVPETTPSDEFPKLINDIADKLKDDNRVVDELKFVLNDNFPEEELSAMNDIRTILDKMREKNLLSENNFESLEAYLKISHKKLSKMLELFRNSSDGKIDESLLEEPAPVGQFMYQSQRPKDAPYEVEEREEWGITCYAMDKRPHGLCAIFNNQNFSAEHLGKRKGSEIDRDRLSDLFKYLRYDVKVYDDLSAERMDEELEELSQLDHTDYDSFVCCILTHGADNDIVYGSDGAELKLWNVLSYFYAKKCRTLFGKPKIFFIQACRGDMEDAGFTSELIEDIPKSYTDMTEQYYDSSDLPDTADFLIAFPTSSGYVSWRSHNEGTWYIESLCDVMKENHNQHDLLSLLTMVNGRVAERRTTEGQKQMPAPVTRLRKKINIRN